MSKFSRYPPIFFLPPASGKPQQFLALTTSSSFDVQHAHICQKPFRKKRESLYTFYSANFPGGALGSLRKEKEKAERITISLALVLWKPGAAGWGGEVEAGGETEAPSPGRRKPA